jgi:membrane protein implicated in regulation of membrane protease activity
MLLNPTVLWLLAGSILCLMEFFLPTAFNAFSLGVGAFLVGALTMVVRVSVGLQIFLWMLLSLGFVYLSHRLLSKGKTHSLPEATEGETLTEILPGKTGRVLYEGNSWQARCLEPSQSIGMGEKVYIVERKGTTLIVLPDNYLP